MASMMENEEGMKSVANSMVVGNLLLNIVMSASMNLLWSLVNTLQVIVSLPLLNVNFPPNAFLLSTVLNKIANFNVIPMEEFNASILDFDPKSHTSLFRFHNY